MNRVRSNDGTLIAYESSGSGPALLLVHGGMSHPDRWMSLLPDLEPAFTVHRMARRGVDGSSEGPDYSPERQGEDVAAVAQAIGAPVAVLGHSYGAICALEGATLSPAISRLVLYEPPYGLPKTPPGFFARLAAMLEAGDRDGVFVTFNREMVHMPDHEIEIQRAQPSYAGKLASIHTVVLELRALEQYRFDAARMSRVQAHLLLLLGGESPTYFRAAQEMVQAALPQSRLVVLPGQKHIAMDTARELFLRTVMGFLSEDEDDARLDRRPPVR